MKYAAILTLACAAAAAQDTATVDGMVVNKITGTGIEGVTVWLWTNPTDSTKAVTNEAGIFRFTGLKPGFYRSSVQKNGYTDPRADALPLLADPPKHHIGPGPDPFRLRFELFPPAVLRGSVVDVDGHPARASVELQGTTWRTDTDADGLFVFDHMAPGAYMLLARPKVTVHASGNDQIRREPVPTYYPSSQDRTQAGTIVVRAGAELSGYEIRLQSAEVHRVRGIVLDRDGKPAAKARVSIQRKIAPEGFSVTLPAGNRLSFSIRNGPAGGQGQEAQTLTAEDGVFDFPSIRAGEWMIQVHSDRIPDDSQNDHASVTFRVEHNDLDELKIQLAKLISLSFPAAVVFDDGSPSPPGVFVGVSLFSEIGTVSRADTRAGGVLRFDAVIPGTHRIMADVTAGNYYIDSIWAGSTNITGQNLELPPALPPMKIILKPAGKIRGTLEEADAGAVVLFPQNVTGMGYLVQSNAKTFEMEGIPPGAYYAIALDRFDPFTMPEASYLRGLMPKATSVRLEPGSTESIPLRVNHVD